MELLHIGSSCARKYDNIIHPAVYIVSKGLRVVLHD